MNTKDQWVVPMASLTSPPWLVTMASMAYSSALAMVSREALAMVTALSTTCPVAKGTWMKPARIWGY